MPHEKALAAIVCLAAVAASIAMKDTDDGLRGFEVEDADGYVLFFGRPR